MLLLAALARALGLVAQAQLCSRQPVPHRLDRHRWTQLAEAGPDGAEPEKPLRERAYYEGMLTSD